MRNTVVTPVGRDAGRSVGRSSSDSDRRRIDRGRGMEDDDLLGCGDKPARSPLARKTEAWFDRERQRFVGRTNKSSSDGVSIPVISPGVSAKRKTF